MIRIAVTLVLLGIAVWVQAEPYFAVGEGLPCSACHFNATGGGLRNAYGNGWAQTSLTARRIEIEGVDAWTGELNRYIALGGNLRANATHTDIPHRSSQSEFDLQELRAYVAVQVIPSRLALYVDQRIAPGSSANLEAYARYTTADQRWYVKAGQFYLPFGWRLEDDTALIRQVSGINMTTPDEGVEVGFQQGPYAVQLAVSNGTAAGPENDEGKQASLRGEFIQSIWRIGASYNFNHTDAGNRSMQGLFAGLRTGPITWLGEADYIRDGTLGAGTRKLWVGLLEANWSFARGHNLKLTAEAFEPDTGVDEDEQNRYGVVWEYFPVQFVQLRLGARVYDGIPQSDLQNRKLFFAQVHGFF
jgi:hypothetical protein